MDLFRIEYVNKNTHKQGDCKTLKIASSKKKKMMTKKKKSNWNPIDWSGNVIKFIILLD